MSDTPFWFHIMWYEVPPPVIGEEFVVDSSGSDFLEGMIDSPQEEWSEPVCADTLRMLLEDCSCQQWCETCEKYHHISIIQFLKNLGSIDTISVSKIRKECVVEEYVCPIVERVFGKNIHSFVEKEYSESFRDDWGTLTDELDPWTNRKRSTKRNSKTRKYKIRK